MQALRQSILKLRDLNHEIGDAVVRTDPGRSMAITSLRLDFAQACGDFLNAVHRMPVQAGDNSVFVELQERYLAMQASLRQHQLRWTPEEITSNRTRYLAASKRMSVEIERFVRDCLDMIADGSSEPKDPGEPDQAA